MTTGSAILFTNASSRCVASFLIKRQCTCLINIQRAATILSGDLETARLLREIAEEEGMDHFARELALIGKVGPTAENVADAMKSEMSEQIGFYTKFAEAAEKAGDTKAAALFREIAQDEKHHFELLQSQAQGVTGSPGRKK